jgi:hypothetical protein
MNIGDGKVIPNNSTDMSRWSGAIPMRGYNPQRLKASQLARCVCSSPAPPATYPNTFGGGCLGFQFGEVDRVRRLTAGLSSRIEFVLVVGEGHGWRIPPDQCTKRAVHAGLRPDGCHGGGDDAGDHSRCRPVCTCVKRPTDRCGHCAGHRRITRSFRGGGHCGYAPPPTGERWLPRVALARCARQSPKAAAAVRHDGR